MAFGMAQYGYTAFLIGSICCLYVAINKRDNPLIILNGTFFVANTIGLIRAFI